MLRPLRKYGSMQMSLAFLCRRSLVSGTQRHVWPGFGYTIGCWVRSLRRVTQMKDDRWYSIRRCENDRLDE